MIPNNLPKATAFLLNFELIFCDIASQHQNFNITTAIFLS